MAFAKGCPKALLIDLSGTIHVDSTAIRGAVEAVGKLKEKKVPHLFVTNTSKESQRLLWERLNRIGFDISQGEIFSSLSAAKHLVLQRNLNPMLVLEDEAAEDFAEFRGSESPKDAVVVGLAPSKFNYETLTAAFRLLKESGAPLIAVNKARYFAASDGGLNLGAGCFVSGLEYSAGVRAEVVGKPEESFFEAALLRLNGLYGTSVSREETVMVGDDVRDDVVGAQECRFMGCLVRTGKYRPGDENLLSDRTPDFVFASIAEFVQELSGQMS